MTGEKQALLDNIAKLERRQAEMADQMMEQTELYVRKYLPKLIEKMPPRDLHSLITSMRLMMGQTTGNIAGEQTVFMFSGVEMPKTGGNPE